MDLHYVDFFHFGFMVNFVKYMVAIDVNKYRRVGDIAELQPSSVDWISL